MNTFRVTWKWQPLVHVCRRWRHVIFASPRGLDLRLVCTRRTPVQEMVDIWPAIPIIIFDQAESSSGLPISNIIAALERHDRIFGIWLDNLTHSEMQLFSMATNNRFPVLTHLELGPNKDTTRALPLGFLGGFTPCLRIVRLNGVPFPALPHVLLSAKDLVELQLWDIPTEGYISPMAMVAGLSALARLQKVSIEFRSKGDDFYQMSLFPHPRRHIILPTLTHFRFRGTTDYVEDFVSRIQAPSLYRVKITLFNQLLFNIPQLTQFIKRTEKLRSFNQASIAFRDKDARLSLLSSEREVYLALRIACNGLEQQVSSLAQVCSQLNFHVSRVELLDLEEQRRRQQHWQDMDARQWLELFQTFTAVNTLRLATEAGSLAWRVLQGLTAGNFTEMLPALCDLYVGEHGEFPFIQEALDRFLSARKRSGHTVAVHLWESQKERDSEVDNT